MTGRWTFRNAATLVAALATLLPLGRAVACNTNDECSSQVCRAHQCFPQPLGLSHIAEVQLKASALTPLVNAAVWSLRDGPTSNLCDVPSFNCPLNPTHPCVLNRVEVAGPIALQRSYPQVTVEVSGTSLQYAPVQAVLPLRLFIKPEECIANPLAGCPYDNGVPGAPANAVFDLSAEVEGGKVQLCGTFAGLVPAYTTLPPIPRACIPLDQVTAMTNRIGTGVEDLRISANDDLSRIAVRVWFQTPWQEIDLIGPSADTYRAFLNGIIAPSPKDTDWSVFIGEQLFLRLARESVFNLLQSKAAAAGYSVFPDTPGEVGQGSYAELWLPLPKMAAFTLYARAKWGGCEGHFSLTAATSYSLTSTALKLGGHLDYNLDSISGCMADVIPGATEIAEAFIDGNIPSGTFFALGNRCRFDLDTLTFRCDLPTLAPEIALLPAGPGLQVSIDHLESDETGLFAGGALHWGAQLPDAAAVATATGFGYGWDGSCSNQTLTWRGEIDVTGRGRICSVKKVSDPLGEYEMTDLNPSSPLLPKNYALRSFWGDEATYPFQASFRTTNGSGAVTLPIPTSGTTSDIGHALATMVSQCELAAAGWLGIPGKWNPHWSVDPPLDPSAVLGIGGRNVTATVVLKNVQFSSTRRGQVIPGSEGRLTLRQQGLHLTADAWVQPSHQAAFQVPISVEVTTDLNASAPTGSQRITQMIFNQPVIQRVTVPRAALPADVQSLSFTLGIAPQDLTLVGFAD